MLFSYKKKETRKIQGRKEKSENFYPFLKLRNSEKRYVFSWLLCMEKSAAKKVRNKELKEKKYKN